MIGHLFRIFNTGKLVKLGKIKNSAKLSHSLLQWENKDASQTLYLLCVMQGQNTTSHSWSIGHKLLTQITLKLSYEGFLDLNYTAVCKRQLEEHITEQRGRSWHNPSFTYNANLHLHSQSHLLSLICLMISPASIIPSVYFHYSEEPKACWDWWNAFSLKAVVENVWKRLTMFTWWNIDMFHYIHKTIDVLFWTEICFPCAHIPLPHILKSAYPKSETGGNSR